MARSYYVEPVPHEIILCISWMTEWTARMLPSGETVGIYLPENYKRMLLLAPPTPLAPSPLGNGLSFLKKRSWDVPTQCRGAAGANGEIHKLHRDDRMRL